MSMIVLKDEFLLVLYRNVQTDDLYITSVKNTPSFTRSVISSLEIEMYAMFGIAATLVLVYV